MSSVTIKDIAAKANVSHTTVSRALNDCPLINAETRKRIHQLARDMNYVPNRSAKGLVRVRSYNIGVFFTSLVRATSSDFIYTIIQHVSANIPGGYNIIFNGIDKLTDSYDISPANYDGVLLVSQNQDDDIWIRRIRQAGVPLVVINRQLQTSGIKNIYCEEKKGVQEAVSYLIENGHREIAYIKGSADSSSTLRRFSGFAEEMERHDLPLRPQYIQSGDYSAESGYKLIQTLLRLDPRPSVVLCASDAVAFGAARAIHELGLHIPRDISLVGFDDGLLAAYSYPPLTSISRPIDQMAAEGARQLLRLIEGETWQPDVLCYPVRLSVKGSVYRLKD